MPVVLLIPWASLDTMAATGSPGIRRGKMKFNRNAQTNVIKNQASLLRKYFWYAFKAIPPHNDNQQPCSGVDGTWLLLWNYDLLFNQRQVIQACNAPTVSQVERRDGRIGAIPNV